MRRKSDIGELQVYISRNQLNCHPLQLTKNHRETKKGSLGYQTLVIWRMPVTTTMKSNQFQASIFLRLETQKTATSRGIWVFPKIGVPQNGWGKMENPIKMDDLGALIFLETPIWPWKFRTSWWLNQPIWKICSSDHFPQGWKWKRFKTTN